MATPEEKQNQTPEKDVAQDTKAQDVKEDKVAPETKEASAEPAKEADDKTADVSDEQEDTDKEELDFEAIKKDLDAQKALVTESEERYKRLQADFINFRRRNEKERGELSNTVLQGLIKGLLPIVDNFERALSVEEAKGTPLHDGITMVYNQLMEALKKDGLEVIKADQGDKFDPNFHQAVMRVQDPDKEDNTIEEELQKGYMVSGFVIRPTMVKVVAN